MEFKDENDELLYEYLVNGNAESAKQLAQNNIKLVSYMVKKIFDENKVDIKRMFKEYISAGTLGLMKAINSFDASRIGKLKFSTYASVCIENEIRGELTKRKKDERLVSLDYILEDGAFLEEGVFSDFLVGEDEYIEKIIESDYSEYKNKKIISAFKKLNGKERFVASLLYGLNGNDVHTRTQIAEKLGVSVTYIRDIINSVNDKLAFELDEFRGEYFFDYENLDNKMYALFEEKDRLKVKNALRYLPKSHYKILSFYYGLEGKVALSVEQLSEKYDISENRVKDIIGVSIIKLQKFVNGTIDYNYMNNTRLDKYLILIARYGEEKVKDACERLEKTDKEIIDFFYGDVTRRISLNEIKQKYGFKANHIEIVKDKILALLEEILKSDIEVVSYKEKFYSYFDSHTRAEVDEALAFLDSKQKNVITDYYGLNCQKLTLKETMQKYNITSSAVYYAIRSGIDVMCEMLGEKKKKIVLKR